MPYFKSKIFHIFNSPGNYLCISCYKDIADEVIVVGDSWPEEFKFDLIGQTYQEGFEKSSGDWVIRMDLDYFFHEKDITKIRKIYIC